MIQFRLFPEERTFEATSGLFLESLSLLWQEFTAPDIPSALSSTGCCSITLTGSWRNMRLVSSGSTASSVRSSRKSWSATSTAATRAAGLLASAALGVGESASLCFRAAPAIFVPPATPRGLRSGASGCGRHSSLMSLTARSSSPSLRCCAYSSSTTAGCWGSSAA